MFFDPLTLVVAPLHFPTANGVEARATGSLYLDDEFSLAHETHGMYAVRTFTYTAGLSAARATLICTTGSTATRLGGAAASAPQETTGPAPAPSSDFIAPNLIERVVIAGQTKAPKRVLVATTQQTVTDGLMDAGQLVAGESVELMFTFDSASQVLTIKKPMTKVIDNWVITIEF
jgi:hypothetical protein